MRRRRATSMAAAALRVPVCAPRGMQESIVSAVHRLEFTIHYATCRVSVRITAVVSWRRGCVSAKGTGRALHATSALLTTMAWTAKRIAIATPRVVGLATATWGRESVSANWALQAPPAVVVAPTTTIIPSASIVRGMKPAVVTGAATPSQEDVIVM